MINTLNRHPLNRFLRISRNVVLIFAGLIVLIAVLVNLTPVQNFLVQRAVIMLATKLDTKVSVKHVRIDFLNHAVIEGLYIEDKAGDTLLYAGEARVRITDWFVLKNQAPVITYVGLHDAYVHMYRTAKSADWNYKFIEDAFDTGKKDSTKKQNEFQLDLEKADLKNVRFHMDDAWVGSDMDIDVGSLEVNADEIDLKKRVIDVNLVKAGKLGLVMRDYVGGRPPKPKKSRVLDTTAFNKGGWNVKIDGLVLEDCFFWLDGKGEPTPGEFDPAHMHITGINIDARNINVVGDTLHGRMESLAAKDQSGIMIRKASADVTVSPNASIAKNLYLETNNSKLRHYYAMHYTRFPDFNDYINKVVMVADLRNSTVDVRDIAYFAPVLRKYPTVVKISGSAKGTVANIAARNLQVSDGSISIKGDVKMKGLPDINTTWIEYNNGEILTSGAAIMKYAPELKGNPNLALERVTHAYFKGGFTGYIENFAANGSLVTNLGSLQSDVTMNLPDFRQQAAIYSGKISTSSFDIGTLLRQPDLGTVTLSANVRGSAFDPKVARINLDAVISHLTYKNYPYKNITAKGLLEKNTFNGDLMVDDPNLALAFNGIFDFSKDELAINAKANLLKSDLTALNLTKDTLSASGDFDLDWQGNSIDNFLGYAKLYNINVLRNGHRLDLDSIYLSSAHTENGKLITIESNALRAVVRGNFQLSSLPASFQSYIGSYLPNYIAQPKKVPADQNLTFEIKTKDIDSLLGVISPSLKGFRDATITGALNTSRQQLTVDATIPYGQIDNIRIENASITSVGDFRQLGLNATAENVKVGDLHGALSITSSVGNDSLFFKIASTSTSEYGTATINGLAYAAGDTMHISLMPSEFYLAKARWEIAGGSETILSNDYLFIKNLRLSSDKQEIFVNSEATTPGQPLVIQTSNLDVAHLGNIAGLSTYKPAGRLNGTIKIANVLSDMLVNADIKATEVQLGEDTIGNINVIGSYDAKKQLLILDPATGVYRGNSSITAGGRTVFDSTSNARIDGSIKVNNAPIAWIAPFVEGYVSNLAGTLNGTVQVKGTASEPDVDGSVGLDNAHLRIDFLGTAYDIPSATINVNNSEINFGDFTLFDSYKNRAIFNGKITHNRFKNLRLAMNMGSSKFQVLNLKEFESEAFYGNLIAGFQNLSITGPVDDIRIRITRAMPADKSQLYIPIGTTTEQATYNYVTFKSYDTTKLIVVKKPKNKLNITIDARLNTLAEITLVLDPTTGDAIVASGTGNLNMEIPSDNDIRMYGTYDIEKGSYLFTLRQLFFKRKFDLNAGSRITFNGLVSQTSMNVEGIYTVRTRLYDLLKDYQKTIVDANDRESKETKTQQDVNVVLFMKGSLENPALTFKLDVPEGRTQGTIASDELRRVNQNETELFNHVASLLLIGSFYPQDNNISTSGATAGAISNVSQVLSGTASSQLTNLVTRLTGSKDLSLNFKYSSYSDLGSATDPTAQNRNAVSLGLNYNLSDRLSVEYGGSYDWGKQSGGTNRGSVLNPVGNFRLQYQLKEGGNTRGYIFRTSSFDALGNQNLERNGIGLSWRKSFNSLGEFFRGDKYAARRAEQQLRQDSANDRRALGGTW